MKKLILSIALFVQFNAISQTKQREELVKGEVLPWKITRVIENESDTLIYFYYGYQNKDYDYITDIGSIIAASEEELQELINALNKLGNQTSKTDLSISTKRFRLVTYNFSNQIYLYDEKSKYTTFSKRVALQLAEELLNNKHLLD